MSVEKYELFRIEVKRAESLFEPQYVFHMISKGPIDYIGTICHNKFLTQIVFPGE
jgi:hypothetical protein